MNRGVYVYVSVCVSDTCLIKLKGQGRCGVTGRVGFVHVQTGANNALGIQQGRRHRASKKGEFMRSDETQSTSAQVHHIRASFTAITANKLTPL